MRGTKKSEDNLIYGPDSPPRLDYEKMLEVAVLIHGHLGPFLVYGIKMGLLARQILGFKGHFDVKVEAFVGDNTPVTCMADGLQISTGATLGKRNIKLADMQNGIPAAVFDYKGKRIKIALTQKALDLSREKEGWEGADEMGREIAEMDAGDLFQIIG